MPFRPRPNTPPGQRFVAAFVPFIFAIIGLAVLIFLWAAPFGQWDSPPIFFRIFGSLIALIFVVIGGYGGMNALSDTSPIAPTTTSFVPPPAETPPPSDAAPATYTCPSCGAPLTNNPDVSPSGDVKCPFCGRWFNIHHRL